MKDDKNTINDLKDLVKKFCDQRDWKKFHNPKDLAIGISTEAAELLQIFRFKNEHESKEMLKDSRKREEVGEELADVLYFVLRFAQLYDFDLSDELKKSSGKTRKDTPLSLRRAQTQNTMSLEVVKNDGSFPDTSWEP